MVRSEVLTGKLALHVVSQTTILHLHGLVTIFLENVRALIEYSIVFWKCLRILGGLLLYLKLVGSSHVDLAGRVVFVLVVHGFAAQADFGRDTRYEALVDTFSAEDSSTFSTVMASASESEVVL